MQMRVTFWAALMAAVFALAQPTQAQVIGGIVSLDAPREAATLNSLVSVEATLTPYKGWNATKAIFEVNNSNGFTTNYNMIRVGNSNRFRFIWDSMLAKNETYYLRVKGDFSRGADLTPMNQSSCVWSFPAAE